MTNQNNAAQPVLTDDEIRDIENCAEFSWNIPRAIESAVLSKLRAEGVQAGDEREALAWYAEQVAGCRKIGADGDAARQALDKDGGQRARAALASAPVADQKPIQLSDDVLQFLKDGVADATQCEEADVDQEFADQLLLLIHKPLYTEPLADYRAVEWGPLVIAPVAGEAQPAAWRVVSADGRIRTTYYEAPDDVRLAAAKMDGDTIVPMFDHAAPQASAAQKPVGEVFRHGEGRDENGPRVGIRMLPAAAGLPHGTRVYAAPQASEAVCSCPTGDGSLRHPCDVHPPAPRDCAKGAVVVPSVGDRARWAMRDFMKARNLRSLGDWEAEAFVLAVAKQIADDRAALSSPTKPGKDGGGHA